MSEREQSPIPERPDETGEPHDVLAAEEFPGPSPEAAIHEQGHIELPPQPDGDEEPHDVLAAEEFAMPAPRHHGDTSVELTAPTTTGPSRAPLLAGLAAFAAGAVAFSLKRRARRRSKLAQLRDRLPGS